METKYDVSKITSSGQFMQEVAEFTKTYTELEEINQEQLDAITTSAKDFLSKIARLTIKAFDTTYYLYFKQSALFLSEAESPKIRLTSFKLKSEPRISDPEVVGIVSIKLGPVSSKDIDAISKQLFQEVLMNCRNDNEIFETSNNLKCSVEKRMVDIIQVRFEGCLWPRVTN